MNKIRIGHPLKILPKVKSTNDFVLQKIADGNVSEGMAWHADYQYEGKGQRGKVWMADPGDNINLSILLCPMLRPDETFVLNAVIALAVYDFYCSYVNDEVRIKWSNDLYIKRKKGAGILIENIIRGSKWKYAVVGIGLNLNQEHFDERLPNPVSLKQITGKHWDAAEMAGVLCRFIEERYHTLKTLKKETIINEYEKHLFRLHEAALFQKKGKTFEATILGVKKEGQLILKEKDGTIREVNFGEIKFVI